MTGNSIGFNALHFLPLTLDSEKKELDQLDQWMQTHKYNCAGAGQVDAITGDPGLTLSECHLICG